jgi:septum formation protein
MPSKPRLILASASPRRKSLMREAGYRFKIIPSHVSERAPRGLKEAKLVTYLALKKALSVSKKYPFDVILGADTLVFLDHHVIGKPRDHRHAAKMLGQLSGRWQKVYTGVAVVWEGGKQRSAQSALSYVKFRDLKAQEIQKASKQNLDKAGAYAVQEKRDGFVEKIRGDYNNVVGLPMRVVKKLLGRSAKALAKRIGHKINFKR